MKSGYLTSTAILLAAWLMGAQALAQAGEASKAPLGEPKVLYVLDAIANNTTAQKSDGVTLVMVSEDGQHFRALGGFHSKALFGRMDALGAKAACPPQVTDMATSCFGFDGTLHLGNDGSGFPADTRAGLHLSVRLKDGKGTGDFQIAPVGELLPQAQHGTLELPQSRTEPQASLQLAHSLHLGAEHDAAFSVEERLLSRYPDNADIYWQRGRWLGKLKRETEAIADLRRVTALKPDFADAWGQLGWFLLLQQNGKAAQEACIKAQTLKPDSYAWTVNLGHTYLLQGDRETAYVWYKKILPLIPDEASLTSGPLADFELFIQKGWQVEPSRTAKDWFTVHGQAAIASNAEIDRLNSEGIKLHQAGQYAAALVPTQRALAISEKANGPEHPLTCTSLNNLALLHQAMGQYARAEPLLVRALAISEKTNGPEHPTTGMSMNNLAKLYQDMGQYYARAETLLVRALAISEKINGQEHPTTGMSLNNLADLYQHMGQYARAEPLYVHALAISEKANGPEHPSTGTSLNNLALLYQHMGQYARAEPLYVRALAILEKAIGPEHHETGSVLSNLATLYQDMGQYARAESLYVRALAISEKAEGPEHPSTGTILNNLAELYRTMGQYARSEPFYVRALAISEKAEGPEHPLTGTSLNNLALLYHVQGRFDDALPLYERALAISEKSQGPEHASTGRQLNNLAGLYESMGQYARAEPLYLRAWRIASTAATPELSWTVQDNLSRFYTPSHPELAIWYGKQAVNTLQTVRSTNTALDTATQKSFLDKNESTYKKLADLLFAQGRLAEGQQVLAMLKEAEYFDFIQRNNPTDPRTTRVVCTGHEQPWCQRYEQISNQLAAIGKEHESLRKKAKDDPASLTAEEQARKTQLESDLEVARKAYDAFMVALKREFTQNASADRLQDFGEKNLASLRALQGTLRDLGHGAVTLHYLMTDKRLWILLTTPTVQIQRESPISEADLNRQIGHYREAIKRRDPNIKTLGKALYDLLIAPVAADLQQAGAQTLMLSLDGAMRYLPMAALYDGEHYLSQRYRLAMYTSAAKDKLKDKPQTTWTLAGFGLTQKIKHFAELPSVKSELEGILQNMSGHIKLDGDFTAQAFKIGLESEPPVVHLASHFVFQPGNETHSFLLMGDGSELSLQSIKDGYQFINLDLLTLSACETAVGGGKDENGREVEGFGALAQNQGAKGVIATLWSVADQSTGQFMQLFYGYRQHNPGITKAQALQMAQQAFIEGRVGPALAEVSRGATRIGSVKSAAAVNTTDHPYYWAPFILMGNWL
ncbi:tetratricopeptide repeat protein [Candidatus Symbiobacter mobilis]|uniref:TPR repeat protein n=1 Tax=Candidatus Symbiobacter mobilis CR TaxID=946483 RepID=U5N4W9_9BURK|nr:tetratricopeptide repeat protein [Candidatus Symbiobacter mobilis]AGX86362.1 TPR repeat protein [Candidatus Symbiobacter mobilis CR]